METIFAIQYPENQRYYDLKRTGQALAVLAAHAAREKVKKNFPVSFRI